MAKDIPPVLRTDSTHLQPEPRAHLKRDDSGFFSPLSGGTTPVAATPQPIAEEEREAEMDGSDHDSRPPPLVRRHSSDDVTRTPTSSGEGDEARPLPRTTRVPLGHMLKESPPESHPCQRDPAAAAANFSRSNSLGAIRPGYLANSFHYHREQLSRAGVGPLPVNLVTNVNTRAEEIMCQLEREDSIPPAEPHLQPISLPNLCGTASVGTLFRHHGAPPPSLLPLVPLSASAQEALHLSTIPEDPGNETTSPPLLIPEEPHEQAFPYQDVLATFDERSVTPGQDGHYFEKRDYDLNGTLGKGGFGMCLCGRDIAKDSLFALKRNCQSDEDKISSIVTEVSVMSRIGYHDNVTRLYGAMLDDYTCEELPRVAKMIMELAEHGNLHEMLVVDEEPSPLPSDQSLYYLQQILQGVHYLHSRSFIHLDIKAANVLVFNGGRTVKLADMGSSLHVHDIPPVASLKGCSPHWAAPEVVQQRQPTFSADIWSVSCVLVEMLTAMLPGCHTMQRDQSSMIFLIGNYTDDQLENLVPLSQLQLEPGVEDLFQCVFRRNPRDRPTADHLLQHPHIIDAHEYEKFFDISEEEEEEEEEEEAEEEEGATCEDSFYTAPTSLEVDSAVKEKPTDPEDSGIGSFYKRLTHRSSSTTSNFSSKDSRDSYDSGMFTPGPRSAEDLRAHFSYSRREKSIQEEGEEDNLGTNMFCDFSAQVPDRSLNLVALRSRGSREDFSSLPPYASTPAAELLHFLSLDTGRRKPRKRPSSIHPLKHSNSLTEGEDGPAVFRAATRRYRYRRRKSLGEKSQSFTDTEVDGVWPKSELRRTSSEKYVDRGPDIDTPTKDGKTATSPLPTHH